MVRPSKHEYDKRILAVGKRIRRYRESLGCSQDEFAALVDFSRAHVGRIERGEVNLSVHTLFCLSDVLRVPVEDLVRDKD